MDLPDIPRPKIVASMPVAPSPLDPLIGMISSFVPGADALIERISVAGAEIAARIERTMDLIERIADDVRVVRRAVEERRIDP